MKKVLVVDDDPELLSDVEELVQTAGYQFHGATDGHRAMELLESVVPDLIVLDLRMPNLDGWTLHVWLKADPRFKDVPVVILSAVHVSPRVLDAMNAVTPSWIEKPLLPDHLIRTIDFHLARAG